MLCYSSQKYIPSSIENVNSSRYICIFKEDGWRGHWENIKQVLIRFLNAPQIVKKKKKRIITYFLTFMERLALQCYQYFLARCEGQNKLDSFNITSESPASSTRPEFITTLWISVKRKNPYYLQCNLGLNSGLLYCQVQQILLHDSHAKLNLI